MRPPSARPSDVIAIQSMTATKQKKFAATEEAVHGAGGSAEEEADGIAVAAAAAAE